MISHPFSTPFGGAMRAFLAEWIDKIGIDRFFAVAFILFLAISLGCFFLPGPLTLTRGIAGGIFGWFAFSMLASLTIPKLFFSRWN